MTRRMFLAALMVGVGSRALGVPVRPDLTFGVASDIHVLSPQSGGREPGRDIRRLRKALMHFRDEGVDAVVMAGDFADTGLVSQLIEVGNVWDDVFPNDCLPDGRRVEKVFVTGNHDIGRWPRIKQTGPLVADDLAGSWMRAFHEKYEPVFVKAVRGYSFVGAHWGAETKAESVIVAAAASRRPFFYVQHNHPKGTVYWNERDVGDGGLVTDILSRCPLAVAFSGHSHRTLLDERSVWQGTFTSVGTGCLQNALRYGRENFWSAPRVFVKQMDESDGTLGGNYMICRLYGMSLTLERWSSEWHERLGPDWVVDLSVGQGGPYDPTVRAGLFRAPEFPAGSKLDVAVRDGHDETGKIQRQVVVGFPAAGDEVRRVMDYDIRIEDLRWGFDRTLSHKRVNAEDYDKPPSQHVKQGCCVFAVGSEVPEERGLLRVSVRPYDSLGNAGQALVKEGEFDFR